MQARAVETREALLEGAARVFSRLAYSDARLKEISREARVSEGAIYFHFGNKDAIAVALLDEQQARMTAVLTRVLAGREDGRQKLYRLMDEMAALIASDVVVQAGISLSSQPIADLRQASHGPYFEWIQIVRTMIKIGVDDQSIFSDVDIDSAAEFVNASFVGAQVLSGLDDRWASLPDRVAGLRPYLQQILTAAAAAS